MKNSLTSAGESGWCRGGGNKLEIELTYIPILIAKIHVNKHLHTQGTLLNI